GDVVQVFNIGAASVGSYGLPAGVCAAAERFGRVPLAQLVAPAARLARDGVVLNAQQAYVVEILAGIITATPEARSLFAPGGPVAREGDVVRQPELADALERLGTEGPAPFYTGDIAAAVIDWLGARGGRLTQADLAAYRVVDRAPVRARYRGRDVLTNPPPSAGGILIARALGLLDGSPGRLSVERIVEVMEQPQRKRPPTSLPGFDPLSSCAAFSIGRSARPAR